MPPHIDQQALALPEVPNLPTDNPVWAAMAEELRAFITVSLDVAQNARALAARYQELLLEAEALRSERDELITRLYGEPITAH